MVLTGANGAGKTNLLEAVSFLTPGRGLRAAPLDKVARMGTSSWAVAASIESPAAEAEIGTGYSVGETGRSVRIDRRQARTTAALGEYVRALWLTPAMDGLFTGPASERRRFLDRLVLTLDPGHASRTADFEKAMRQRNRLLEEQTPDRRWLDGVETQMARLAVAVAAARNDAVARLSTVLEARAGGVFPIPVLAIDGDIERETAAEPAVDVEEAYARRLRDGRAEDRAARRALSGPHRSDLVVVHRGRGMPAALASTGEQKGLLISLILAHSRVVQTMSGGIAPILLLDEIAAHLDDMRRAALFADVLALGTQAWMTGTDRHLFSDILDEAQPFEVASGTVMPG